MDAESALADLTEISSQVERAVVFEEDGSVLASTSADDESSQQLARAAAELFTAATELRAPEAAAPTQLEVALRERSFFAVRDERRTIAATVAAGSPAGLVLYDLRTCLRAIEESEAAAAEPTTPRKRGARKRSTADA
jgi:predicted regulator of Ras-like GTPase activity (Roadblock/LC7/MglB family)